MKLNKTKIARLTDHEARSVRGGGTNGSTNHNFTCCWCTGGNTNDSNEPTCDTDPDPDPDPTITR